MPTPEEDLRAALHLLEPKIVEFEARSREAASFCAPGDPMLQVLHRHQELLEKERVRLLEQLRFLQD